MADSGRRFISISELQAMTERIRKAIPPKDHSANSYIPSNSEPSKPFIPVSKPKPNYDIIPPTRNCIHAVSLLSAAGISIPDSFWKSDAPVSASRPHAIPNFSEKDKPFLDGNSLQVSPARSVSFIQKAGEILASMHHSMSDQVFACLSARDTQRLKDSALVANEILGFKGYSILQAGIQKRKQIIPNSITNHEEPNPSQVLEIAQLLISAYDYMVENRMLDSEQARISVPNPKAFHILKLAALKANEISRHILWKIFPASIKAVASDRDSSKPNLDINSPAISSFLDSFRNSFASLSAEERKEILSR